ncbi:hypothetical protein BKA62DRAFT_52016 [Auriculariales sp. MPI-PUGE-AT-0066]|nr:hypothetical protein BKA62DRAFT_52016 [Auriculariales sp. MPI-PUGE-AT-0066]
MMDRLPVELFAEITEIAAFWYMAEHRATVVALAQVSKQAYTLLAPIMYHDMHITPGNSYAVVELFSPGTMDPLGQRVCAHVRVLYVASGFVHTMNAIRFEYFTALQSYHGPTNLLNHLSVLDRTGHLRYVIIQTIPLTSLMLWEESISQAVKNHVTHFTVRVPPEFRPDSIAWCQQTLASLPVLTHFGLSVCSNSGGFFGLNSNIVLDSFEHTLRAALGYSRLRCVALHIGGLFASRWPDIRKIVCSLRDRRLQVWKDDRHTLEDFLTFEKALVDDFRLGRTIWTESRCVEGS